MNIIRCTNGHFFDKDSYETCPHCGAPAASGAPQKKAPAPAKPEKAEKPEKKGFSLLGFGHKKEQAASPVRESYQQPEAPAPAKSVEYDPGQPSRPSFGGQQPVFVEPSGGKEVVGKTMDIYGIKEASSVSRPPVQESAPVTQGGAVSYDPLAQASYEQPSYEQPSYEQPSYETPSYEQPAPAAYTQPSAPQPAYAPQSAPQPVYSRPSAPQPVPQPASSRPEPLFTAPEPGPAPQPVPQPAPQPAPAPAPAPQSAPSLQEMVRSASANEEGKTMSYFSAVAGAKAAASQPAQESGAGQGADAPASGPADPVVGWLVCVKGHNFGRSYPICAGKNSIGRSQDNRIVIAGENSVSRQKHAIIVFEPRHRDFYLQPGDSSGLTYLNDDYLMEMKKLSARDVVDLGESRFIFVPLCGEDFTWEDYLQ